ncbi:MAG: nucleotidyltransferase domain-containing protein [Fimbriimonadales bacterium]
MTSIQYLQKILQQQRLSDNELTALKNKRHEVESFLKGKLESVAPTIRWAGSYAKDTMIRENYDADIVVYIASGENGAGNTLAEIYDTIEGHLKGKYSVERKASAIRLRNAESAEYTHVDVVPGRFFDETMTDVWLHRTTGDKSRFKTNLDVHIETVRDSAVKPLIRLMKLWTRRNGIVSQTFIIELLTVKIGSQAKCESLDDQVVHVLKKFRDEAESLTVEDPANPNGNDISNSLDNIRFPLQHFAKLSLQQIDGGNWNRVFGDADDVDDADGDKARALRSLAVQVRPSTRPWFDR